MLINAVKNDCAEICHNVCVFLKWMLLISFLFRLLDARLGAAGIQVRHKIVFGYLIVSAYTHWHT